MEVKIPKSKTTYIVEFHHNIEMGKCGVTIRQNGRFVGNSLMTLSDKDKYCRNCGRKEALARAFKSVGEAVIPREHRYFFWETYRKLTKKPRWPKSALKLKTN